MDQSVTQNEGVEDQDCVESKKLLRTGPRKEHLYRPFATRLPVLLLFAGLLASYIGLIELLLHRSSKYEAGNHRRAVMLVHLDSEVRGRSVAHTYKETIRKDFQPAQLLVNDPFRLLKPVQVYPYYHSRVTAHDDSILIQTSVLPCLPDFDTSTVASPLAADSMLLVGRDATEQGDDAPTMSANTLMTASIIDTDATRTITVKTIITETKTVTVTVSTTYWVALSDTPVTITEDLERLKARFLTLGSNMITASPRFTAIARYNARFIHSHTQRQPLPRRASLQAREDVTSIETEIVFVTVTVTDTETFTEAAASSVESSVVAYLSLGTMGIISTTTASYAVLQTSSIGNSSPTSVAISQTTSHDQQNGPTRSLISDTSGNDLGNEAAASSNVLTVQISQSRTIAPSTQVQINSSPPSESAPATLSKPLDMSPQTQVTSSPLSQLALATILGQPDTSTMTSAEWPSAVTYVRGSAVYLPFVSTTKSQPATDLITTSHQGSSVLLTNSADSGGQSMTYSIPTSASAAYLVLGSGTHASGVTAAQNTMPYSQTSHGSAIASDPSVPANAGSSSTLPTQVEITDTNSGVGATSAVTSTDRGTTSAIPWPIKKLSDSERIVNQQFTHTSYFAAIYLAPILAVVAKAYWEIVYSTFKMTEPFERLAEPKAFLIKHALFAQCISCSAEWDAWKVIFCGRSLPMFNITIYVMVTTISTLAASSMKVQGMSNCLTDAGYVRCAPAWIIETPIIRALEGLLIACTAFILIVACASLAKRRSIVAMNTSSICSVAALFNHEGLAREIHNIDPMANISVFRAAIGQRHAQMHYHEDGTGEQLYGIHMEMPQTTAHRFSGNGSPSSSIDHQSHEYLVVPNSANITSPWRATDRLPLSTQSALLDATQLTTTLALFIMVLIYLNDTRSDPFNNFFNSNNWRPRFVFALVAVLLDIQWKRLEREIRITDPYRRLALGNALPQTTILISLHGTCWSKLPISISYLLKDKHMWFQALVTVTAALFEFNIIAASTVAFDDGQTWLALRIGGYISVAITALMMLVMLITILWWRRVMVIKSMPRCPDTVGAVFSYLCGSQMAREFSRAQFETLTEKQRNALVIRNGRRYRFGLKEGDDGIERWCIDFEDAWKPTSVADSSFFDGLRLDLPEPIDLNSSDRYV